MSDNGQAWRNRIIERRMVSAGELRRNPANFRRHGENQAAALRGLLNQVGIVAPLIAYHSERAGGDLTLIDGELRDKLGGTWPCDILDLNDAEADLLLSSYDHITGQATIDPQALMALLQTIEMTTIEDDGLAALLGQMENQLKPPDDPNEHWVGMPEFEQEDDDAYQTIVVHFDDEDAVTRFGELMEQTVTNKTKWIWYPHKKNIEGRKYQVLTGQ
jgi:hypothetical protein